MRRSLLSLAAFALVTVLSGCITINSTPTDEPSATASGQPTASAGGGGDETPRPTPSRAEPSPEVRALTCAQLETAALGSDREPYNGYADPIPLLDGLWSGEDGVVVQLQAPCAIGDLTGDGAADALVPVLMDGGGTGKFWQVVVFGNVDGEPAYLTMADIGDRTPVEKVSIRSRQATVVYLTRPEDASMAEIAIRRTAIYRLDGSRLVEVSRSDEPYTP